MKIQPPSALSLASVHLVNTASGQRLKVRLISPDRLVPDWRTYLPHIHHDDAVRRALRSAGVVQAMCQAALPMEWTPGHSGPSHLQASATAPGFDASGTPD